MKLIRGLYNLTRPLAASAVTYMLEEGGELSNIERIDMLLAAE